MEALREAVLVKKMPFFGLCVGTQLLAFARVSFDEKLWSSPQQAIDDAPSFFGAELRRLSVLA